MVTNGSGSIGTHLAEYTYLGLGMVVKVDYTEPDIRLDLAHGGGSDPYDGVDRFDRVQDLLWRDYGARADAVRIKHGYDRASNRLWREDPVAAANSRDFDEHYTYDGIYQLKMFKRGNLNANKDGIVNGTLTFEQNWGFDCLGNWSAFKEDTDGNGSWNLDQTRAHNKVNEITSFTGGSWPSPAYDRNGNMTTMPQPAAPTSSYTATYDSWNRLVKLVDPGTTNTVAEYAYDGQKWRIITKSSCPTGRSHGPARACAYCAPGSHAHSSSPGADRPRRASSSRYLPPAPASSPPLHLVIRAWNLSIPATLPRLTRCSSSNAHQYHTERNHQGLDNRIIDPDDSVGRTDGDILCRERLGGLLKHYHHRAA